MLGYTQLPANRAAVNRVTQILNKPTLSTVSATSEYTDLLGSVYSLGLPLVIIQHVLAPVATAGTYASVTGQPNVATSGKYTDLTNAPALALVATASSYASLTGKPNLTTDATSGKYKQLTNTSALAPVATVMPASLSTITVH